MALEGAQLQEPGLADGLERPGGNSRQDPGQSRYPFLKAAFQHREIFPEGSGESYRIAVFFVLVPAALRVCLIIGLNPRFSGR